MLRSISTPLADNFARNPGAVRIPRTMVSPSQKRMAPSFPDSSTSTANGHNPSSVKASSQYSGGEISGFAIAGTAPATTNSATNSPTIRLMAPSLRSTSEPEPSSPLSLTDRLPTLLSASGHCHQGGGREAHPARFRKSAEPHVSETEYLGEFIVSDGSRQRPPPDLRVDPVVDRGEDGRALMSPHRDIGERYGHQSMEVIGLSKREGRPQRLDGVAADYLVEELGQGGIAGCLFERRRGDNRRCSIRRENPRHLGESPLPVPEEHRGELAHHPVEGSALERKFLGESSLPIDGSCGLPGDSKHSHVGVDPCHPPGGACPA